VPVGIGIGIVVEIDTDTDSDNEPAEVFVVLRRGRTSPNYSQKRAILVQPIDIMGVPLRTLRKKPNEVADVRV
jgi:hypothetical protein